MISAIKISQIPYHQQLTKICAPRLPSLVSTTPEGEGLAFRFGYRCCLEYTVHLHGLDHSAGVLG